MSNGDTLIACSREIRVPAISKTSLRDDCVIVVDSTGKIVWEHPYPKSSSSANVLTAGTGLSITGDSTGNLLALRVSDGTFLVARKYRQHVERAGELRTLRQAIHARIRRQRAVRLRSPVTPKIVMA
jgi:hypothetical protein